MCNLRSHEARVPRKDAGEEASQSPARKETRAGSGPSALWTPPASCARGPGGAEKAKAKVGSGLAPSGPALGLRRGAAPERSESLLRPLPSQSSLRGSPRCLTPRCAEGSAAERLSKSIICSLEAGLSKGSLRLSEFRATSTFFPGPLSCKGIVFCHLFLAQ